MPPFLRASVLAAFSLSLLAIACGTSESPATNDPSKQSVDPNTPTGSFTDPTQAEAKPDGGDPYANDPAPKWCGPSGKSPPPPPGGTADCPTDKNKPGCACDKLGEQKPCWTGLRINRSNGVCKDGVATCERLDETRLGWSNCQGEVLPTSGVTKGKNACKCFSAGQWKINNLSPCFITWPTQGTFAVSSTEGGGGAQCPNVPANSLPPPAVPSAPWSSDSLNVDCAGHFKLCYELKAGNGDAPAPGDCSLAKVCVEADYLKENVEQAFPALGGWTSANSACAAKFNTVGGYGEMSVVGQSVLCDKVDDGAGNAYVFNRVKYCPASCNAGSTDPACANCQAGGSGSF